MNTSTLIQKVWAFCHTLRGRTGEPLESHDREAALAAFRRVTFGPRVQEAG